MLRRLRNLSEVECYTRCYGSGDATVRIFNSGSGAQVKALSGHTDWVYAVAFSPDGNLVASGSFNGEVKIWKVADGAVVKAFNGSPGLPEPAPPKK